MDEKTKDLEKQVQTLRNIAWVIGVVAIIFGASEGWGLNILGNSNETIEKLEKRVTGLSGNTDVTKKNLQTLERQRKKYLVTMLKK